MSNDATFDMIQAGKKVRCLMVPFGDPRELGNARTVAEASPAPGNSTLQDLLEERRLHRPGVDPVKKIQPDYPPDEFYVPVNRTTGIVGEDR